MADADVGFSVPQLFVLVCIVYSMIHILKQILKRRNKSRCEVIIFTRYPVPGKAKTRLIPALGENGAAQLQIHMVTHFRHCIYSFV